MGLVVEPDVGGRVGCTRAKTLSASLPRSVLFAPGRGQRPREAGVVQAPSPVAQKSVVAQGHKGSCTSGASQICSQLASIDSQIRQLSLPVLSLLPILDYLKPQTINT